MAKRKHNTKNRELRSDSESAVSFSSVDAAGREHQRHCQQDCRRSTGGQGGAERVCGAGTGPARTRNRAGPCVLLAFIPHETLPCLWLACNANATSLLTPALIRLNAHTRTQARPPARTHTLTYNLTHALMPPHTHLRLAALTPPHTHLRLAASKHARTNSRTRSSRAGSATPSSSWMTTTLA
jgi:hypothetical protein